MINFLKKLSCVKGDEPYLSKKKYKSLLEKIGMTREKMEEAYTSFAAISENHIDLKIEEFGEFYSKIRNNEEKYALKCVSERIFKCNL
jgi:hypothetical protein